MKLKLLFGTLIALVTLGLVGGGAFAADSASVPEPGSLGLLAFGGTGLLLWRRRRKEAAYQEAEERAGTPSLPQFLRQQEHGTGHNTPNLLYNQDSLFFV